MYTSIRLYVYTCIRVYVYSCIRVYVYTYLRVYVYLCIRVYVCVCVHYVTCLHVCTYARYLHTCTHERRHACTRLSMYVFIICIAKKHRFLTIHVYNTVTLLEQICITTLLELFECVLKLVLKCFRMEYNCKLCIIFFIFHTTSRKICAYLL